MSTPNPTRCDHGCHCAGSAMASPEPGNEKNPRPVGSLPETGFVRLRQVLAVIPISRASWWAWCASGKAPKPLKLGPRTTVWRVEDIRAYIEASHAQ